MRKAVDELSNENLLVRRQGRAHSLPRIMSRVRSFGFVCGVPDDHEPTPATSIYLDCKRTRATGEIADTLRCGRATPSCTCAGC